MDAMKASDNLRGFVDAVAKLSTWALVPLVVITMWDVICLLYTSDAADE